MSPPAPTSAAKITANNRQDTQSSAHSTYGNINGGTSANGHSHSQSHQPQPQTQSKPSFSEPIDLNQVNQLSQYLGPCNPNEPVQFMRFVDKCQEYNKLYTTNQQYPDAVFRMAVLKCVEHEAYHWYVSMKSTFDDQSQFLKALQRKFKDMVLAAATREMALLETESLAPQHVRDFLEQFYSLADVIEHFNRGTNVYGLLYKRLYKHDQIKKHLMGPGRESDLLTNCMDIKAITLREEYAENSELIQRAMSTSSKNLNSHNYSASTDYQQQQQEFH